MSAAAEVVRHGKSTRVRLMCAVNALQRMGCVGMASFMGNPLMLRVACRKSVDIIAARGKDLGCYHTELCRPGEGLFMQETTPFSHVHIFEGKFRVL